MRSIVITAALLAAAATGCYTEADVGYTAGYAAPAPDLVYVSPGVQVVADYDYPVFFSDGVYWRYDGGVWYRSPRWNGGWAVSYNVPVTVRGIDRPGRYVHYRAGGGVMVRDHRGGGYYAPAGRPATVYRAGPGGPVVRDHRSAAPVYRAAPPPRRGPVVRDHRR